MISGFKLGDWHCFLHYGQRDRHKNKHTDIVTYRLNQSRVRFSKKYQNLATVKYEVSAASTEEEKKYNDDKTICSPAQL